MSKKKTKTLRAEKQASLIDQRYFSLSPAKTLVLVGDVSAPDASIALRQSYISRPKEVGKLSRICRGGTVWCGA